MHRPERWGYVQFSTSPPGTKAFQPDPTRNGRDVLMEIYHLQLKSLSAEFLLENVQLAYRAWSSSPWKDDIPQEIFFNNVLPYANINPAVDLASPIDALNKYLAIACPERPPLENQSFATVPLSRDNSKQVEKRLWDDHVVQKHVDRFFGRLIENLIVFEDVNPNRVYLTGYSAGGDV
jgi:hypothetical protein